MRTGTGLIIVILAAACSQNADKSASQSGTDAIHPPGQRLFSLLSLTSANYKPFRADELANESDIIATGRFVRVSEGMEVRRKYAKVPTSLYTIVMALEVTTGIKGTQPGDLVYIEFIHGGALPVSAYASNLTQQPITVFLGPAGWNESDAVEYVDVGTGYPAGNSLYRLRTPQGLLIERDGQLFQPLEQTETLQLFSRDVTSLQDISAWYEKGAPAVTAPDEATMSSQHDDTTP